MVPSPRLSEKKACPNALTTTPGVIFEKSGVNRKANPSPALGIMSELTQNITSNTNRAGIMMFDIFSIPFFTPLTTMI